MYSFDEVKEFDPEVAEAIKLEVGRQNDHIELIASENFVSKAPEKIINAEREKLAKYEEMLKTVTSRLAIVEKKL